MRNCLLFILILASSRVFACGFTPYGEETRFYLFLPSVFENETYSCFEFSTHEYYQPEDYTSEEFIRPNIDLWHSYCQKKVDHEAIKRAVYALGPNEIDEHSSNEMIRYLFDKNDKEALDYLRFAKNCESCNNFSPDQWEREDNISTTKRSELVNKALLLAQGASNATIQRRYSFLAVRLAFYNQQNEVVQEVFNSVFSTSQKDVVYYWSLYFYSLSSSQSPSRNFELAQIFANAPDKRFSCHLHFNRKITLEQSLSFATSNIEKANVWLLYAIEKPDKTLEYLEQVYALNPSHQGLNCLVMREVSKVEDYVLTPYYTLFEPAIFETQLSDLENRSSFSAMMHRSELDRRYARRVLNFLNSADMRKVDNAEVWETAKAYMYFLVRDYDGSLEQINSLLKRKSNPALKVELEKLKAIVLTANQIKGRAVIPIRARATIELNKDDKMFLFALAKELEYLGNTTEAALLLSQINVEDEYSSEVFWRARKKGIHTWDEWLNHYTSYINVAYSPEQLQVLINDIQENKDRTDSFSQFLYERVQGATNKLYDLLGTKYMRQNRLEFALDAFSKVDERYNTMTYTAWGSYYNVFEENPFVKIKYTPDFITYQDTIRLSKKTITKQLLEYLARAEDDNELDRDYYYFMVATAYYNMGFEGNSNSMRRMDWWYGQDLEYFDDRNDFFQSNMAKKYYLLAMQHAATDRFKALCLRMVARCEKHRLMDVYDAYDSYEYGNKYDSLLSTNTYLKQLKEIYPAYYDDLVSSCDNFKDYFDARR
ncbi:MAG: hypothetical protein RLZZ262_1643 [Bacteroidota bacterium]|jgi:hypothetical protein